MIQNLKGKSTTDYDIRPQAPKLLKQFLVCGDLLRLPDTVWHSNDRISLACVAPVPLPFAGSSVVCHYSGPPQPQCIHRAAAANGRGRWLSQCHCRHLDYGGIGALISIPLLAAIYLSEFSSGSIAKQRGLPSMF